MILTSNQNYANWGEIFGDPITASIILDRAFTMPPPLTSKETAIWKKEKRNSLLENRMSQKMSQKWNHSKTREGIFIPIDTGLPCHVVKTFCLFFKLRNAGHPEQGLISSLDMCLNLTYTIHHEQISCDR